MSTDHLPIFSGIQLAELCCLGATLSLAKHGTFDPDHILHGEPVGLSDVPQERQKSRHPFVPAARKLLNDLYQLGIHAAQWTNYRWSGKYSKRTSIFHVFISRVSSRPLDMSLPRTSWVKLNCLWIGIGYFHSSMYKWGLAPLPNCECGITNQTADHIISTCPIH